MAKVCHRSPDTQQYPLLDIAISKKCNLKFKRLLKIPNSQKPKANRYTLHVSHIWIYHFLSKKTDKNKAKWNTGERNNGSDRVSQTKITKVQSQSWHPRCSIYEIYFSPRKSTIPKPNANTGERNMALCWFPKTVPISKTVPKMFFIAQFSHKNKNTHMNQKLM